MRIALTRARPLDDYEALRRRYRPRDISWLLIAESPPPPAPVQSSRQFYYTDRTRQDDRLFTNTVRALYPEAADRPEAALEADKAGWLERLSADGYYMIEALEESQPHEVSKEQRQERIRAALPRLLVRVRELATANTQLILIKSNVYEVAAQPLRAAGFRVPQEELVDYPGRFNQRAYREKLRRLVQGRRMRD